ncbi:MAG: peptidoglycan editing factor PgeF [Commensalibacter sp.]|nr:peptidoglycan editing factor PgeF [Commensalibacter sp.]
MNCKPLAIQHSLLSNIVRHGFFTRIGGVSQGEYTSLNCGLKSGDNPHLIMENRKIVAEYMKVSPNYLWGGLQIHSNKVLWITKSNCIPVEGDGAVTTDPDIAISVVTADCAPVLFSTKTGDIVGAAHAGWRGAACGILENVVDQMEALGADRQDIIAVVGPCIAVTHYEVREDMRNEVLRQDPDGRVFFTPVREGYYLFDLGRYCIDRLRRKHVGIAAITGRDTFMDTTHFFSNRRRVMERKAVFGHQISTIACRQYS